VKSYTSDGSTTKSVFEDKTSSCHLAAYNFGSDGCARCWQHQPSIWPVALASKIRPVSSVFAVRTAGDHVWRPAAPVGTKDGKPASRLLSYGMWLECSTDRSGESKLFGRTEPAWPFDAGWFGGRLLRLGSTFTARSQDKKSSRFSDHPLAIVRKPGFELARIDISLLNLALISFRGTPYAFCVATNVPPYKF